MSQRKEGSFLLQGSILALAGIISRLIGLIYRVPLLNIVGEDGMGVYNTAYNIYSILLFISSYSLPQAVAKIISEKKGLRQYRCLHLVFLESLGMGMVLGLLAGGIMYFGADIFAVKLMKMPESALSIRMLAPAVVIMGVLGVLRGFFQGQGTMTPTAISQILEQLVHVAVSLYMARRLRDKGFLLEMLGQEGQTAAYSAMGATVGIWVGALAALLFLLLLYFSGRERYRRRLHRDKAGLSQTPGRLLGRILLTALPFLISSTFSNIGTVVDQAVYGSYVAADYKAVWGDYSAKYTVLTTVPIAIASALSTSTIPAVSSLMAQSERKKAMNKAAGAIRLVTLIALPASVGLSVLGKPCLDLLFAGKDNALAGQMLAWGSLIVLTFSLSTITVGVLQGSGFYWAPIKNYAIALVIHIPLLAACLWLLKGGIMMVVVNHVLYSLIVSVLNYGTMARHLRYRQEIKRCFLVPALCSLLMGGAAWGAYTLLHSVLGRGNTLSTLAALVIAVGCYGLLLLLFGNLTRQELLGMPRGEKLVRLFTRLGLLRRETP